MIAVTGATDGPEGLARLRNGALSDMGPDDYLIILGGCSLCSPRTDLDEQIREYRVLPCQTLFLDGARDDYDLLSDYPSFRWNGGLTQSFARGLRRLLRGQVFRLAGRTFFVMGGAATPGRDDRGKYWDWWPGQDPDAADATATETNLAAVGWRVDFVLSVDCPASWRSELALPGSTERPPSAAAEFLDRIATRLDYGRWYCGGYTTNRELPGQRANFVDATVVRLQTSP